MKTELACPEWYADMTRERQNAVFSRCMTKLGLGQQLLDSELDLMKWISQESVNAAMMQSMAHEVLEEVDEDAIEQVARGGYPR